jgi:hypothetical protein
MQAAEHGANFPMAKKLRQSMTHEQLHDFSVGSERGKPEHVRHSAAERHPEKNLGKHFKAPQNRRHGNLDWKF